jgi:hypothetical protein
VALMSGTPRSGPIRCGSGGPGGSDGVHPGGDSCRREGPRRSGAPTQPRVSAPTSIAATTRATGRRRLAADAAAGPDRGGIASVTLLVRRR